MIKTIIKVIFVTLLVLFSLTKESGVLAVTQQPTESELVQLKLNIETSVGESTSFAAKCFYWEGARRYSPLETIVTEAEYRGPLPLEEVGVSRLDETEKLIQAELNMAKEKETGILVQYKPGSRDRKSLFSTNSSLLIKQVVSVGPDILIVTPRSGVDSSRIVDEIGKDDSVIHIESNTKHKLHVAPNDPSYAKQWGLKTIMAEKAWTDMSSSKKSIIVAVIDSGLELSHSDLLERVMPGGYNFILGSDYVYDVNGHGTAVSGVIAAKTNNGLGIAGVAGTVDVRILPLQVADYAGESFVSDVISAIDYAIAEGADVINLSLGSNSYSAVENEAVQRAIQAGVIVVASAGNNGNSDYTYPASYDNVISVGSINRLEDVSNFSNFNDKVTVVAPGEEIYSCSLGNSYSHYSGTSFSAPMVAGIVAVLRAIEPSIPINEVKNILETSVQDKGIIGRDSYYGYGVANMDDAVKQVSNIPVDGIFKGVLWDSMDSVSTDKKWKIVFSEPLNNNGIPEGEIYVIDEQGEKYPTEMTIGNERSEISISPKEPYQLGKTYYLMISDLILSQSGKPLANAVKMKFTIQGLGT